MGTSDRDNFTRIVEHLESNATRFNIFAAFFLSETLLKKRFPDHNWDKLKQPGLNFRPYEYYEYPPTDLRSVKYINDKFYFVLNIMGLYGIDSPIPQCYHNQIPLQQMVHQDKDGNIHVPLQDFLDIFNNRLYWLYYQAWKKYRYYLHYPEGLKNRQLRRLFTFAGLNIEDDLQHETAPEERANKLAAPISPFQFLPFSGILSQRVRSKTGLHILLSGFFPGWKFHIHEFVPTMIEAENRPKLGSKNNEDAFCISRNNLVGKRVRDSMSRICVEIGPIYFEDYLSVLPGEKNAGILNKLLDIYLNDGLTYNVKLVLLWETVPPLRLGDRRLKIGRSARIGKATRQYKTYHYTYENYRQLV